MNFFVRFSVISFFILSILAAKDFVVMAEGSMSVDITPWGCSRFLVGVAVLSETHDLEMTATDRASLVQLIKRAQRFGFSPKLTEILLARKISMHIPEQNQKEWLEAWEILGFETSLFQNTEKDVKAIWKRKNKIDFLSIVLAITFMAAYSWAVSPKKDISGTPQVAPTASPIDFNLPFK